MFGTNFQGSGASGGGILKKIHYNAQSQWATGSGTAMTTPPLITQGMQYVPLTTVIIPTTNLIRVILYLQGTQSGTSVVTTGAVFINSFLACFCSEQIPGNNPRMLVCSQQFGVSSGVEYTFTVRIGNTVANAVAVNGTTSTAFNLVSVLYIEELIP